MQCCCWIRNKVVSNRTILFFKCGILCYQPQCSRPLNMQGSLICIFIKNVCVYQFCFTRTPTVYTRKVIVDNFRGLGLYMDLMHCYHAKSFWRQNSWAQWTHDVDFARARSRLTRVPNQYTSQLPAFVGVNCNHIRSSPLEGEISVLWRHMLRDSHVFSKPLTQQVCQN